MKGILLGIAAALTVVIIGAAAYAITKTRAPGSDVDLVVSTSDVVGVPFGSTVVDTRNALRRYLQASEMTEWAPAPHLEACGFSHEQLIIWDDFEATFARSSSTDPGVLVAATSFRPDVGSPSGVAVGLTIDEVQRLGGFLAYPDGPVEGEGVEFAALEPLGVNIIQIAQFDAGIVDAVVTGIPCVVGLDPPYIPTITTTTSTTTTSTTTTTRPTTTTTRATTTTRRTTTTRPATPEWEVGWCVMITGTLARPVDCSSLSADYAILAVVAVATRCPSDTEYTVDLDDGSVVCIG